MTHLKIDMSEIHLVSCDFVLDQNTSRFCYSNVCTYTTWSDSDRSWKKCQTEWREREWEENWAQRIFYDVFSNGNVRLITAYTHSPHNGQKKTIKLDVNVQNEHWTIDTMYTQMSVKASKNEAWAKTGQKMMQVSTFWSGLKEYIQE